MADLEALHAQGWRKEVSRCGGCVAALQGAEIHVAFTRAGVLRRQAVREFLGPLLDEMGLLTTRVFPADQSSARFVRGLGFRRTWGDDNFDYYMLTALPFGRRETTCLQQQQS